MSFTRLKYDLCEQQKHNKESAGPGSYRVNQPLNCGACFQINPMVRMQKSGVSLDKNSDWRFYAGPVDVESELFNLTRVASKCDKYLPTSLDKNPREGDKNIVDFPNCYFPSVNTRLINCTVREAQINRFQPLCLDPQKNLFFQTPVRIPTRLVIKDRHKTRKCIPKINNMSPHTKMYTY